MEILSKTGRADLAEVYVARMRDDPGYVIEFVDACGASPGNRSLKWVIVISTQFGCPVNCRMCDAGGDFRGNLTFEDLRSQIETVFSAHDEIDPRDCQKLKVQFARMGEPSFNDEVLELLRWFKDRYPNIVPCVTTMTPIGREQWFEKLLEVRDSFSDFQLQFSINSTDDDYREKLMPYPKMSWDWLADFGREFFRNEQRKIVLNFAICPDIPVQSGFVKRYFDPKWFIIKMTPVNPTSAATENGFTIAHNRLVADNLIRLKSSEFENQGYAVIQSIGDMEENLIGSNCGQMARRIIATS